MKRGIVLACALIAATLGSVSALHAAATPDRWTAGTHYTVLGTPQPPAVRKGKVEVNEVFWYGCSHCYALEPRLESWKASKPAYIEFVRIPVVWGPMHAQHARLFYTLQALGRNDLHAKVFDAIHLKHNPLAAQTDEQARALHLAFFRDNGVTEKKFIEAYDSAAVNASVERARDLTARFEVGSVPLMVVQGTYVTGVSMTGSEQNLLAVVEALAAKEKGR
jgi:thiol:disulfide interchange protein DsbA